MVATKSRCGSCNCNELSPRHLHRGGNRFLSLRCGPMTIMLATLMIFSYAAEAVDSDMVPSHYGGDLEQTIRDSVKNEIEMELDRESEKASVVLSIEYPDKEIGNNVVITQTDSDSATIVVNGETVREVRNLHEDSDKNIDLAVADERESPEEEVQSVEKQEKVEEPKAHPSQSSASSSSSSESENAAASVETSENLIEKDTNDVVQKPEGKEETDKQSEDNGESQNALEQTMGEQIKPEIHEEEAKSSTEEETVREQGVGEESIREEPSKEEIPVKEEVVKAEDVNEEVVKEGKVNKEAVKEEAVESLVPEKVAADDEAAEIPLDIEENIIDDEVDSGDQKPIPIEETKTLVAPSDIAEFQPTPETEIKAEEPTKTELLEAAESANSLLPNRNEVVASESQHKGDDTVEEKKEEVAVTEKTPEISENPLDKQPIQEDSNEEVLSVVLNENATILESPQSSSFEPEQIVPIKVEETAGEQGEVVDEPVPPQEPEHTVIKKQGVDLQQEEEGQEDDGEIAEGTSRPEEEEAESVNAIKDEEPEVKDVQEEDQQEIKEAESEVKNEEPVQQVEVEKEEMAVKEEEQEVKVEEPEFKEEEPEVNVVDTEVTVEESKVQKEPEVQKEQEAKKEDNQIPNESDLGEVPEADDNTYDDDEEVGQPEGEISQSEAQPTPKEPEIVAVAQEKQEEPAVEEKQDASATEPAVVETEATIAAFTSEKSSSLVSEESAAATMFESFQPRNAGQRFNNNVLTAESGMGKALETRSINETPTYRSSVIIALCSGVAVLFVLISVTIFIISFQRQHGTLDIEMQEKRCGKDDRDDDPESCLKLLDIELPITMLSAASVVVATTEKSTPKTSMIIMEERGEGEEAVPMTTTLHADDIDETL